MRLLRTALDRPDVLFALAFGLDKWEGSVTDLDVLVVGEVDDLTLADIFQDACRQTRLEILSVWWPPEEFSEGLRTGQSFVASVVSEPKIFIKGDEDALRKLIETMARSETGGF